MRIRAEMVAMPPPSCWPDSPLPNLPAAVRAAHLHCDKLLPSFPFSTLLPSPPWRQQLLCKEPPSPALPPSTAPSFPPPSVAAADEPPALHPLHPPFLPLLPPTCGGSSSSAMNQGRSTSMARCAYRRVSWANTCCVEGGACKRGTEGGVQGKRERGRVQGKGGREGGMALGSHHTQMAPHSDPFTHSTYLLHHPPSLHDPPPFPAHLLHRPQARLHDLALGEGQRRALHQVGLALHPPGGAGRGGGAGS